MRQNIKNKNFLTFIFGQRGQGITEYILLLVAVIAILFGALYKMNDAFRIWGTNFFGNYMVCLIENGYLPSLEGLDSVDSPCASQWQDIDFAGASTNLGAGGGNSGSSGGSTGSNVPGSNRSSSSSSDSRGRSRQASRTVGEDSGGEGGAGGGRRIPISQGLQGRGGKSGRVGKFTFSEGDSEAKKNKFERDKRPKPRKNQFVKVKRARGLGGALYGDNNDKKRIVERVKKSREGRKFGERVGKITKQKIKGKGLVAEGDSNMTFGNFFRILVIIALIIAVVIVVGGQILQVVKSSE